MPLLEGRRKVQTRLLNQLFGPQRWALQLKGLYESKITSPWGVRAFCKLFQVNTMEMEKQIEDYQSLQEFFCRRLRSGARPQGSAHVLHPVDARVRDAGSIQAPSRKFNVKGVDYSLADVLGDERLSDFFKRASFISYHLRPHDYHRVHAPCDGDIILCRYIPGCYWPVNNWELRLGVKSLIENERLVILIKKKTKFVCLVMLAAFNVGGIKTLFDSRIHTYSHKRQKIDFIYKDLRIKKAQELALFEMGSSVLLLSEEGLGDLKPLPGQEVKVLSNLN